MPVAPVAAGLRAGRLNGSHRHPIGRPFWSCRLLRIRGKPAGCRFHATTGFTLIEMVCVVAILAIVSAIVVPRFGNSLAHQRADMIAARIARDLTHAQRHARLTSAGQKLVFEVALNRYILPGVPGLNRVGTQFIVNLGEEPYRAQLVSANLGGDAEIIFDGFGRPDSGGEVVVRVGSHHRKIMIDPETGRTEVSAAVSEASELSTDSE